MTPRPDVSVERRNQILDTAESVFSERGFDEARMDDIAEHSGLSKGAIYWYFKKKDDIIAALLDRVFRHSIESMRVIAVEDAPVFDRLIRIGQQISHDYQARSKLMPVALEFYAIALRQRSIRKHLASIYDEMLSVLTPLIAEGMKRGELAHADPRQAAILLVGIFEGLGLIWAISPKNVDWKTLGPKAIEVLCDGLRTR